MITLYFNPFIDHKPDVWIITAGAFLITIFCMILMIITTIRKTKKVPVELSDTTIDTVETIFNAIEKQINMCEDAKDLQKAVEAIGRYERFHMDDPNARTMANKLKQLLDKRAAAIYDVIEPQTIS